jgi:predicted small lipoprotein YifL
MNQHKLLIALAAATTLAACGGGGSVDVLPPPAATQVPDSAMASSQSMATYVKSMASDESSEPLTMSPIAAPMSDTDEPLPGS